MRLNSDNRISKHSEKVVIEFEYRQKLYALLEKVLQSNFLSEGPWNLSFAEKFGAAFGLQATTTSSGSASLYALLKYIDVAGKDVIVPTNSCRAVPLTVQQAGGNIVFADCKRDDFCLGLSNIEKVLTKETKAVIVIHVGGHIAFEIFQIKKFCEANNIFLVEDCCHADGVSFNGVYAGGFGIGGAYSFHASKMLALGEGGMVVSKHGEVIDFVSRFKNCSAYISGADGTQRIKAGFNLCMPEIMAAFGLVQLERLPRIIEWKKKLARKYDQIFTKRLQFPEGMHQNYYRYIVIDTKIREAVGKVFSPPCHQLMGVNGDFPNSEWVSEHHECVPIYYGYEKGGYTEDELGRFLLQ